MGKIVIKKRVDLDFLGEEYKEAYLDFKSIPISDYDEIIKKVESIEKENGNNLEFILQILKKYFVTGKFPVDDKLEDLVADDLNDIDSETTIRCFSILTGQEIDPKATTPSSTPLPTEATTP